MSVATAVRLVHISKVPRALAVFNGENACGSRSGGPLGSYLTACHKLAWSFSVFSTCRNNYVCMAMDKPSFYGARQIW